MDIEIVGGRERTPTPEKEETRSTLLSLFTRRKREAAERQRDYKQVFAGPAGSRVLKDLCSRGFVFAPAFAENPHQMAFNEGRREMVMDILRILSIDEAMLMTLYEEMERDRIDEYRQ